MRSVGCDRCDAADGEPDARVDLGGAGCVEHDVVDAPVGRDRGEPALGEDEDERHGEAGRAQDLAERLRAGQVGAGVEEHQIGFGRSDQLLRRGRDDPDSMRQERKSRKNVIVGRRRQDQQLRHATPSSSKVRSILRDGSTLSATSNPGERRWPRIRRPVADGSASCSVWAIALAGVGVVVGLAFAGGVDWFGALGALGVFAALGVVLAVVVIATLAVQLATRRPEGFVGRVAASIAGAVVWSRWRRRSSRPSPFGERIDSEHV